MTSINEPIISSERLTIHIMTLADAPFIQRLVNTPSWIKYIGKRDISDLDAARDYLKGGFLKVQDEYGFGYYVVKTTNGESIGIAGFLKKEALENEDFGFAFMPVWQGQGYAYEASRVILEYGAKELNFSVLDAVTLPANIASQKLLLNLNFRDTGETIDDGEELMLFRWQV